MVEERKWEKSLKGWICELSNKRTSRARRVERGHLQWSEGI